MTGRRMVMPKDAGVAMRQYVKIRPRSPVVAAFCSPNAIVRTRLTPSILESLQGIILEEVIVNDISEIEVSAHYEW
jgi:hypothetical protein